jgi:hypothetical protein
MPEAEVSADVARELLKRVVQANAVGADLLAIVRALKAFRAVNKTFHEAFEEGKFGCRILILGVIAVRKLTVSRIRGIKAFLRMAREAEGGHGDHGEQIEWVVQLLESLPGDLRNLDKFLDTLRYVRDGNVFRNLEVHHRATLPPHHFEHFSRTHGGIPKGIWKLSGSLERTVAPYRTHAWAVALVCADDCHSRSGDTAYATRLTKTLLRITREEKSTFHVDVEDMRRTLANVEFPGLAE